MKGVRYTAEFLETRWNLKLGENQFKTKLLHLDFIKNLNIADDRHLLKIRS